MYFRTIFVRFESPAHVYLSVGTPHSVASTQNEIRSTLGSDTREDTLSCHFQPRVCTFNLLT